MFKNLFGKGHGGGGGGGSSGAPHQGSRQVTANSTQKTVDAIQKLGEVTLVCSSMRCKEVVSLLL